MPERKENSSHVPAREIGLVFLRLGSIAFGGPAVHLAMMEEEIVRRRGWLTHEEFLDLLGATNLIPGPNSTEMAIHIGLKKGGVPGLLAAGFGFIAPAAILTLLLAMAYAAFGTTTPALEPVMAGIRAAVLAVIAGAVFRLGRTLAQNRFGFFLALAVAVLNFTAGREILLLFLAGIAGLLWSRRQSSGGLRVLMLAPLAAAPAAVPAVPGAAPTLAALALFFLKIGSILYGSGYVLAAFLQEGLVNTRGWITQTQLLDSIAAGQFTPGPVFSTATFVGYLILGAPGALAATVSIFLPSFILVLLSGPLIPKIRTSPSARGFLDGVNAASLGLIFAVSVHFAQHTLTAWPAWLIFAAALTVSLLWTRGTGWLVLAGGLAGWLFHALGF